LFQFTASSSKVPQCYP